MSNKYIASRHHFIRVFTTAIAALLAIQTVGGDEPKSPAGKSPKPTASGYIDFPPADLGPGASSATRGYIERYSTDTRGLDRYFPIRLSPTRRDKMKQLTQDWKDLLEKTDYSTLDLDAKIDYTLLRNEILYTLRQFDLDAKNFDEIAPLTPFAKTILELVESGVRMDSIDASKAADVLTQLIKEVDKAQKEVQGNQSSKSESAHATKAQGLRASRYVNELRRGLTQWFNNRNGYDPLFTWWAAEPYKAADKAVGDYAKMLRERIVGAKEEDEEAIVGTPIGREALIAELEHELIPYTPEELIEIANQEFAWCEIEMKKAAAELGFGDDWKKAVEKVKNIHADPGKQPDLIRKLAQEAIDFVDQRDLVTIPKLARDTWRMDMMAPQAQLRNPFFTGGEVITVSFPTNTMTHEQKLMSMRGNNIHFAHATVHHEVIPGHHLQLFMSARYKPYRRQFSTPFLVEGWALYWELLLWDLKFAGSAEDRVGMLFWRSHRCARILFSLSFHMGKMTPDECINLLVDRVGHERDNAAAEVRRSFAGGYSPLYQAAYLLGGMQLRALRHELVDTGKMSNKAFHDAILKENAIPVELIRAALTKQEPAKDFHTTWKFLGDKPKAE